MVAVAIAALDFGAIRAMSVFDNQQKSDLSVGGALPMANVLAVGLLIGRRRPGNRPFLLGFEAFGVMALAVYVALVSFSPQTMHPYLDPVFEPIKTTIGYDRIDVLAVTLCSVGAVMLGLPQLALALVGGFLSRMKSSGKIGVSSVFPRKRELTPIDSRKRELTPIDSDTN